jgi:hypothetical protein
MGTRADADKARYWRKVIHEAARSGESIREFCRQRRLTVSQFYWWQRRLQQPRPAGTKRRASSGTAASFVLVSEEGSSSEAGIELVLGNGRRLRIHKGVDEATLRSVLAALEQAGC